MFSVTHAIILYAYDLSIFHALCVLFAIHTFKMHTKGRFLVDRGQWTHGLTLMPERGHLHTSAAVLKSFRIKEKFGLIWD